jgi:hypothetical protein
MCYISRMKLRAPLEVKLQDVFSVKAEPRNMVVEEDVNGIVV